MPFIPPSDFLYDPLDETVECKFCPPYLDKTAIINGVLKYDHPQTTLTLDEHMHILSILQLYYDPISLGENFIASNDVVYDNLDLSKAPGPPSNVFGTNKGLALDGLLKHFDCDFDQLMDDVLPSIIMDYDHICTFSCKDELRAINNGQVKEARVFSYAPLQVILLQIKYFALMNNHWQQYQQDLPVKAGFCHPGKDMHSMHSYFKQQRDNCYSVDAKGSDARIMLSLITVIRELRKSYLPFECHKMVDRLYDITYAMNANVLGVILRLLGQSTGQYNTLFDNCLYYLSLFILHSYRVGVPVQEFLQMPLYIMGDDCTYHDTTTDHKFHPRLLEQTYHYLGNYMEADFDGNPLKIQFLGAIPMCRYVSGIKYDLYAYRIHKMLTSMQFAKTKQTPNQRLASMIAQTSMCFADKQAFELAKKWCLDYAQIHNLSYESRSNLAQLNEAYQLKCYTSFDQRHRD